MNDSSESDFQDSDSNSRNFRKRDRTITVEKSRLFDRPETISSVTRFETIPIPIRHRRSRFVAQLETASLSP